MITLLIDVIWLILDVTVTLNNCKFQIHLTDWYYDYLLWNWSHLNVNDFDDKSTLVQAMAWCLQATSHYLSQCSARSMASYGITWPQLVKIGLSPLDLVTIYSSENWVIIGLGNCLSPNSHYLNQWWLVSSVGCYSTVSSWNSATIQVYLINSKRYHLCLRGWGHY